MLHGLAHSLTNSPRLVLTAEQEFEGGSRSRQMPFQPSPCVWFAGVSLAKGSDAAIPGVSVGGPPRGGTQGGSES